MDDRKFFYVARVFDMGRGGNIEFGMELNCWPGDDARSALIEQAIAQDVLGDEAPGWVSVEEKDDGLFVIDEGDALIVCGEHIVPIMMFIAHEFDDTAEQKKPPTAEQRKSCKQRIRDLLLASPNGVTFEDICRVAPESMEGTVLTHIADLQNSKYCGEGQKPLVIVKDGDKYYASEGE